MVVVANSVAACRADSYWPPSPWLSPPCSGCSSGRVWLPA